MVAEDGYDPSTSGLWAQHAPAAHSAAHCEQRAEMPPGPDRRC